MNMTYEDLIKYRILQVSINDIQSELFNINELLTNNWEYYKFQAKLQNELEDKRVEALKSIEEIENYISTINDCTVQAIARKRFILGKTWSQIGREMFMDRTTASRILKNYIKNRSKI